MKRRRGGAAGPRGYGIVTDAMIEVTHPERVLFPDAGWTKADVVAHYARVADAMLPHVRGRPLTLVRHPRGIAAKGFYQKNVGKHYPDFIGRIEMKKRDGVTLHGEVHTADGLCYLANHGAIAFHTTLGRLPDVYTPDRLVMDFDPRPGDVAGARLAAWRYKALLDELAVPSTPLCTGAKGYHVYVALTPTAKSNHIGRVARILGQTLMARFPDDLTHAFSKKERAGRVYVDWQRNWARATVVAPWSLRPRPGAPVAVPITWAELDETAPDAFRLEAVASRLSVPDPIAALDEQAADAEALLVACDALAAELPKT